MQRTLSLSKILTQKNTPLILLRCSAGSDSKKSGIDLKEPNLPKPAQSSSSSSLQVSDKPRASVKAIKEVMGPYPKPTDWKPPPDRVTVNFPSGVDVTHISGVPEEHIVNRRARIFVPAKSAPQAGYNNTKLWKIELDNRERWENALIGWASSGDPLSNIMMNMDFARKEDAMRFCERQGWEYTLDEPSIALIKPKNYGSNYSWNSRSKISTK